MISFCITHNLNPRNITVRNVSQIVYSNYRLFFLCMVKKTALDFFNFSKALPPFEMQFSQVSFEQVRSTTIVNHSLTNSDRTRVSQRQLDQSSRLFSTIHSRLIEVGRIVGYQQQLVMSQCCRQRGPIIISHSVTRQRQSQSHFHFSAHALRTSGTHHQSTIVTRSNFLFIVYTHIVLNNQTVPNHRRDRLPL